MELTFECLEDGRWYVVLPEYEGSHEDLEMVENADNMLRALSTDGMYVTFDASLEQPAGRDCFTLEMEAHDEDGAFYEVVGCDQFSGTVWLCNVVHFVFGDHPERIYISLAD